MRITRAFIVSLIVAVIAFAVLAVSGLVLLSHVASLEADAAKRDGVARSQQAAIDGLAKDSAALRAQVTRCSDQPPDTPSCDRPVAPPPADRIRQAEATPGPAGAPGSPGPAGPSGSPGPSGQPGQAGSPGTQGNPGSPGGPGKDGIPGAAGTPTNGRDGTNGINGADGAAGKDGTDGAPGPAGPPGADGTDGRGITDVTITTQPDGTCRLILTFTDSTTTDAGTIPCATTGGPP